MYFHSSTQSSVRLTIPCWYTIFTSGTLYYGQYPQGSSWYCNRSEVLTCSSLILRVRHPPSTIIRGKCICLAVVILVNKSCYWFQGREKDNFHFKTFQYCTREMTLSWKILFCVLNRNEIIIKLSCPVSISIYV